MSGSNCKITETKKMPPAYIDISVECMHCGAVLYAGVYSRDIVSRLKKLILSKGWVHCQGEGTLCKDCAEKWEKTSG